ncbi:rifamycin-inactivating phosphotransferase [Dyadobacter sp. 676]|uniref:Prodigiosin synthesizing transferase PigC n=1 Tax=Dyadobacter sp. 676 TaxID=3088362 RepID=A0AAU8FL80_9BACT
MDKYVIDLREIGKEMLPEAGGKGANLGELCRIEGIHVPAGFCVSTEAFQTIMREARVQAELDRLSALTAENSDEIAELGAKIRRTIEATPVPDAIRDGIAHQLAGSGPDAAYAVRSSATAEDLPGASFAGQQDSYLNVVGTEAVLKHVAKCWASLFTDRAIIYRIRNGFDHRKVRLAVVVQRMVFPESAGILFTADPVTGNRKVVSIDAGFGLGEALVSGLVNADSYKVRDGRIAERQISTQKVAVYAAADGGTRIEEVEAGRQTRQVLTDMQILALERAGRRIEAHFGSPQDIEWCIANDVIYIVQSRPITTLFPVPEAGDDQNHVYISVGHQQMMTDAMKPLGLSIWQLTATRPMSIAGGRLFVDIAPELASPARQSMMMNAMAKSDPLMHGALTSLLERDDFIRLNEEEPPAGAGKEVPRPIDFDTLIGYDPAVVTELIENSRASIAALKQNIRSKSGPELMDCILAEIGQLRKDLSNPKTLGVIMTAMNAAFWLNDRMDEWLGEKNVADVLSQSVPNNVTSEMGLDLLDVADAIRPYPEVIDYLQNVKEELCLDDLTHLHGGEVTRGAIAGFLEKYGMRCAGEIDITKSRWTEKPATLVPVILGNIKNLPPGTSKQKFEHGKREASNKEGELLDRLRHLPDGDWKAAETKRMIDLLRNLAGYREYPKYDIVSRYFIYKQALLEEAARLEQKGVLRDREDIYYLTFGELRELVETQEARDTLIAERKALQQIYERLSPPRVITSEGEIVTGKYSRENLPAGAIAGLPVSSGVTEGRARVIVDMKDADLEEGDILVTTFTDPSWTPLFVSARGLVTEVGGLMTHGAVIAREYGLPAVVGVENATRLIRDGQRIRVNGTEGFVEILQD